MNRLSQRPISIKAVFSDRPTTVRYTVPTRPTHNSLTKSPPIPAQSRVPVLQDMGTSTSPLKFEEFEVSTVPVQNITFRVTPASQSQRKRRVLVLKHLKNDEVLQKTKSKSSNRSLIRFFDVEQKQEHSKRSPNSRIASSSRPVTSRSQGPVNKRVFSEVNLDYPTGSRMFDICEVMSIAQGEINIRNLKFKR